MKDTSKTKYMTGLMVKIIARVNQNELNRYEKLFNTANAVFKNILPTSFQDEQLKKKQKKTRKSMILYGQVTFFLDNLFEDKQ